MSSEHLGEQFTVPKGGHVVYHGTNRFTPGRGSGFVNAPALHVGTEQAAHERAVMHLGQHAKEHGEDFDPIIYEMTLRTGTTVGPLVEDRMANAVAAGHALPSGYRGMQDVSVFSKYDVLPYTNDYEDVGSTSYVVKNPRAVVRNIRPSKRSLDEESVSTSNEPADELVRPSDATWRMKHGYPGDYPEAEGEWA